jgi:hypothetical protein
MLPKQPAPALHLRVTGVAAERSAGSLLAGHRDQLVGVRESGVGVLETGEHP